MTLKFLEDIGKAVTSPFEHLGHSVGKLGKDVGNTFMKGIGTIHDDVKGITKGAFSLGKDVTGGFQQLTSPIGLIVIGGIIVVVLIATRQ